MRTGKRSFAKLGLQTFLVQATVLVANLGAGVITARWLGPENLGIYFLIIMIPPVAHWFGNLGFGRAISFFMARGWASAGQLARQALWLGLILSSIAALVLAAVRVQAFSPWRDLDPAMFYFFLGVIPLEFLIVFAQRLVSGRLRITQLNISQALNGYGLFALQVVFLILLGWGLWGALFAAAGARVLAALYLLWQMWKAGRHQESDAPWRGEGSLTTALWRNSRWHYLIGFSVYLNQQLPLFVLKGFYANEIIAFFQLARSMENRAQIFWQPFTTVLFPFTAASDEKEATDRTNRVCRMGLAGMLAVTALLVVVFRPLVLLFYGEAYLPAVLVFYAASPTIALWPLGQFLGTHMAAAGKPRRTLIANLGALAVAAGAGLTLIPRYGAIGAGASLSLTFAARTVFLIIAYVRMSGSSIGTVVLPSRADWVYAARMLPRILGDFRARLRGVEEPGKDPGDAGAGSEDH